MSFRPFFSSTCITPEKSVCQRAGSKAAGLQRPDCFRQREGDDIGIPERIGADDLHAVRHGQDIDVAPVPEQEPAAADQKTVGILPKRRNRLAATLREMKKREETIRDVMDEIDFMLEE